MLMNKKYLTISALVLAIIILSLIFIKSRLSQKATPSNQANDDSSLDLPINTLPQAERPFITLSPDDIGRSLNFRVESAPTSGELEYELVYQATGKQEGVFGRLELASEKQPIVKNLLLGSKSAGGKVTYHEGITGGSLTVTYGSTRLKESFSYLSFDPADPTLVSTDGRFTVTLDKNALKKDTRVLTMKTFGYPKEGLPADAKVVAGPYAIEYATTPKGQGTVNIKLPAGEHTSPTIYEYKDNAWVKLATKLGSDSVTASSLGNVFAVFE